MRPVKFLHPNWRFAEACHLSHFISRGCFQYTTTELDYKLIETDKTTCESTARSDYRNKFRSLTILHVESVMEFQNLNGMGVVDYEMDTDPKFSALLQLGGDWQEDSILDPQKIIRFTLSDKNKQAELPKATKYS